MIEMYWRKITSVFAGTLTAQIIPIIGSIFISRIFTPSEFGEFSTWLAIVTFSSIIITLRFEAMLIIIEEGVNRLKAVFFIFLISIALSFVLFTGFVLAGNLKWINIYPSNSLLFLTLIAPAALFLALNQVCQMWAAAEGEYSKLIIMRIVQAATLIGMQITLGLIYPYAISLAIAFVIAGMVVLGVSISKMPRFFNFKYYSNKNLKSFFKRYRKFPIFALPADSINSAVAQMPVLIVSLRFDSEVAGFLALTMRVLGAPVGLIGKAVLDVFKRDAIQNIKENGNCKVLYLRTLFLLAFSALLLVIGTVLFAENIFRVAFGQEWGISGKMAIWMLPMFALGMIASPLSYLAYLVEKQYIDLLWQFGLMMVALINLTMFSTYQSTLTYYSIGYGVMYIIYINISYGLSKGSK